MDIRQGTVYKGTAPEVAVVTGITVGEQWLQYGGKSYNVDDILAVMKAAESGEVEKPNYVVARVNGDHYVLALAQNGVYVTKGNFGDMVRDARQVADVLTKHVPKDV